MPKLYKFINPLTPTHTHTHTHTRTYLYTHTPHSLYICIYVAGKEVSEDQMDEMLESDNTQIFTQDVREI